MIVGGEGQSAGGTFLESLCPSPPTIAGEGLGRFTEPPTTSRRWYRLPSNQAHQRLR